MTKCVCPKCKSESIIPIMYGYPAPEAMEAAMAGELKLGGGCKIYIDGCDIPDKFCKDCEFEWSVNRFVTEDIVKVRFRYWSNWGCIDPESLTEEQSDRVNDFYNQVIWLYRPWTEIVDCRVCDMREGKLRSLLVSRQRLMRSLDIWG